MNRTKKQLKVKEPIKIRTKQLKNGNQSIYLQTYNNGRYSYEFLKLYLIPHNAPNSKLLNNDVLAKAEIIKAQRIIELNNYRYGLHNRERSKMLLTEWLNYYQTKKSKEGQSDSFSRIIKSMQTHICRYKGDKIKLNNVDIDYCKGFCDFLGKVRKNNGKPLSLATQRKYFDTLANALNLAVKEDLLLVNPISKMSAKEKIHCHEKQTTYLTIEEIKKLINAHCSNQMVKKAFLFSCFCGLRISDITKLQWNDIETNNKQTYIKVITKKTHKINNIPLLNKGKEFLPLNKKIQKNALVFDLPTPQTINRILKQWTQANGITSHVTFHTSRHTFGTTLLSSGVDLYTTQVLMGHSDIKTTQRYAKIVDHKKIAAISLLENNF